MLLSLMFFPRCFEKCFAALDTSHFRNYPWYKYIHYSGNEYSYLKLANFTGGKTELSFVIYQSYQSLHIDKIIVHNFTRVIGPYVYRVWQFRGILYPRTKPKMQFRANMTPQ